MQPYYDMLAPGGQVSLAYYFITAPNLPPREFQVPFPAIPLHLTAMLFLKQHRTIRRLGCLLLFKTSF